MPMIRRCEEYPQGHRHGMTPRVAGSTLKNRAPATEVTNVAISVAPAIGIDRQLEEGHAEGRDDGAAADTVGAAMIRRRRASENMRGWLNENAHPELILDLPERTLIVLTHGLAGCLPRFFAWCSFFHHGSTGLELLREGLRLQTLLVPAEEVLEEPDADVEQDASHEELERFGVRKITAHAK